MVHSAKKLLVKEATPKKKMKFIILKFIVHFLLCVGVHGFNLAFPGPKTYWAKQVTSEVYIGGRLTQSQLKQALDAGFKTIIFQFDRVNETVGEEISYDTETTRHIVEDLAGARFAGPVVTDDVPGYVSVEAVQSLTEMLLDKSRTPRPVLFTCTSTYSAFFVLNNYRINQTLHDIEFPFPLTSDGFYELAAKMGYLYNTTELKTVVSEVSGEPIMDNPPESDVSIPNWYSSDRWIIKPVFGHWYSAGQIKTTYYPLLSDVEFTMDINLRKGVTDGEDETPSQEEVTLINVMDNTGTYEGEGRQSEARLLATRIKENMDNDYIDFGSEVNYQARNPLEFGDDVGYNETMNMMYAEQFMDYIHTPMDVDEGFTLATWELYRDVWLAAGESQNVIIHCRLGYRATVVALLCAGYQNGFSADWAVRRGKELGYHFDMPGYEHVVRLFINVLGEE